MFNAKILVTMVEIMNNKGSRHSNGQSLETKIVIKARDRQRKDQSIDLVLEMCIRLVSNIILPLMSVVNDSTCMLRGGSC